MSYSGLTLQSHLKLLHKYKWIYLLCLDYPRALWFVSRCPGAVCPLVGVGEQEAAVWSG